MNIELDISSYDDNYSIVEEELNKHIERIATLTEIIESDIGQDDYVYSQLDDIRIESKKAIRNLINRIDFENINYKYSKTKRADKN